MTDEFVEFPKIARLSREVIVTEKIDGTNAQVFVTEGPHDDVTIMAGSRNRWITLKDDNFGFAAWVAEHAAEIVKLGPGRHFGEWWGSGIQRGYGLPKGEKRWSLFNVQRWHVAGSAPWATQPGDPRLPPKLSTELPPCVGLVPVLWRGVWHSDGDNPNGTDPVSTALERLRTFGSVAAPGFRPAEGLVVYHTAAGVGFKKTIERDGEPKGLRR